MDKLDQYRQITCEFLESFASYDLNAKLIFDRERDRYLVFHNEWRNEYRIYGCAMHLELIEGQIWIQHNSTEIYIDRELIERGVSPKDIILGFRSPSVRKRIAAAMEDK
ncbi:XisI protein [Moorena bouillonii]|uniref:XisI protein n=1 Tax=Moorena bouillonii PNG TaxID=568701 RepID=A0A1U7MXW3_9CYAN|nr:XisI protein [Moorena bouillonii]OLT58540.1 XisI protein [Moorena bouillonii PNG]